MSLLLLALVIPVLGGGAALLLGRRPYAASWTGAASAVLGCALGLVPAAQSLITASTSSLRRPWHVPYGEFYLSVDPLSAVFLVAVFGLSLLAAVYGGPYLLAYRERKSLGAPWFFFNLLVASMALLVTARNGILFLMAWEVMAIASFFLVTFEDERAEVRGAGWVYLIAAHLGTAFLLAFFAILGREAGSLDFDRFASLHIASTVTTSALFLFAVVGFGVKAGFVPLHVWLPEAHPAAPSHVSAVMSGVMIKTGIYGMLRALTFLGPPPTWWGGLLIGIGLSSGILGVLFALAQHDLKRLLAYHSVENIGIIALGMGVGLWGLSKDLPAVALLGFTGAVLHVLNHAAFKGLLFLGAGSVLHATGERDMDRLGGLLKRMPVTGGTFLVGAAAISGLPALNGFVSEFLVFMGSLEGATVPKVAMVVPILAVVGLATIGGLAVACFTKAFGIVFLGSPRTEEAGLAHEVPIGMRGPMLVLAGVCVAIGLAGPLAVRLVLPAGAELTGVDLDAAAAAVTSSTAPLAAVTVVALIVVALVAGLALLRRLLLARREVGAAVTWDCGYESPQARMQYTSSSFAQPLVRVFRVALQPRVRLHEPQGYFPRGASYHSETPDLFTERVYQPVLGWVEWSTARLRWLQHGRVHLYVLYIFIALIALLVWGLGLRGNL